MKRADYFAGTCRTSAAGKFTCMVLWCFWLSACAYHHQQWRRDYSFEPVQLSGQEVGSVAAGKPTESARAKLRNRVLEVYDDSLALAHIEFTDQGGFWTEAPYETPASPASAQAGRPTTKRANHLDALEAWLHGRLRNHPAKFRHGAIVVSFVHGWHNNAREGNANLDSFRQTLVKLRDNERGQLNRPVIGVYLSWRGRMRPKLPLDVPEYLTTFWARKEVAERIGYRGMAETLSRLSLLRDEFAAHEGVEQKFSNSRLFIVSHSFGACAAFSAVSRFFEDELIAMTAPKSARKYVGRRWDLVVLVNPAFEAHRYDIIDRYQQKLHYDNLYSRLPRMLIVGSENDRPNQRLFPLGQTLDSRTWAVQKGEWEGVSQTVGQLGRYMTHDLKRPKDGGLPTLIPIMGSPALARVRFGEGTEGRAFSIFKRREVTIDPESIQPFMVARASRDVVDNHGGIWGASFRDFLVRLVQAREEAVRQFNRFGSR